MDATAIDIRRAVNSEDVYAAEDVLDGLAIPAAVDRFLAEPGHHLLVAYVGNEVAGIVSGVEMTHPDKGTEMFLYELGVIERWRGRGVGRALVEELRRLAVAAGCYGMWVVTDADNDAALRTYRSTGSTDGTPELLLEWTFARSEGPRAP